MIKVKNVSKVIKENNSTFKNEVLIQKLKILNTLTNSLKNATPVDTGHAKDSWKFNLNEIENTAEYIDKLNSGSSSQAPAFFIEKTILSNPFVKPNGVIVKKNNG